MSRILLVTSHPVAPPWDSADKQLAHSLLTHVRDHRFTAFGRAGHPIQGATRIPVWSRDGRPGGVERAQIALVSSFLESTVDLVHVVMTIGPAAARAARARQLVARRRRPVLHTVPGVIREEHLERFRPLGTTVVLSERKASVLRDAGFDDVRVVPPAIALARWPRRAPVRGRPTLLFAGHHDPGGGAEETLRAAAELARRGLDVDVVLAMRSRLDQDARAEAERVRRLAAELGVVSARVLGRVDDMPELLRQTSIVAFPAKDLHGKADVPLVVLEAMATGRPVVLSDLPSFDGLGEAPIRVPAGDPARLAEAIGTLLADDAAWEWHAGRGRQLVEDRHSETSMARAYERLYAELLERRRFVTSRLVAEVVWRGRRPHHDPLALRPALELARRNRVDATFTRALEPIFQDLTEEVRRVGEREAAFRSNLAEAAARIRRAGTTPVLIKADSARDLAYGNFDLVVGDDGWDRAVSALRGWGMREERHPLEPDKLIVHPPLGPAVHLHRRVSWFGVPVIDAHALAARARDDDSAPWIVPAPEHDLLIVVAHAAFQNLAFDLADLMEIRDLLRAGSALPAHVLAVDGGWPNGFRAALDVAREAIDALEREEDVALPVPLPARVSLATGLEHAWNLWRSGRREGAVREVALRGPLVLAKRRAGNAP